MDITYQSSQIVSKENKGCVGFQLSKNAFWWTQALDMRCQNMPIHSDFSLQNLYESIKNEPFKIPEDDGNDLTHTFFNPDREGWLLKLGWSSFCLLVRFLVMFYSWFQTHTFESGIIQYLT